MNWIRYWKKRYALACGLYDNEGKDMKDAFLRRVSNLVGELSERIENLQLEKEGY